MNLLEPLTRRELITGAAGAGLVGRDGAVLGLPQCRRNAGPTRCGGEREARHDRLAADEHARRARREVSLPLDRGLLLAHQRPRRRDDRHQGQHQPAVGVHDRPLSPGLLRRHRAGVMSAGWARFTGTASRIRRSAGAAARMPLEQHGATRRSRTTGRAASISASSPSQREGLQSYVIFIVRDDRACDFLFQCSDTTWAAYNRWPDHLVALRRRHAAAQLVHRARRARRASTGPTASTGRFSTPRCRRAPASSCCGNSRSPSGWSSTATTSPTSPTSTPTPIRRGLLRTKAFLSVGPRRILVAGDVRQREGGASTPA